MSQWTSIGIVGVGKWALQLSKGFHSALRGYGRIIGHVRKNRDGHVADDDHFGKRFECLEDMLDDKIDLVIAAADPITTTSTLRICVENCIPVVATKPLQWHPSFTGAPVWVDFWRLWCPVYQRFKSEVNGRISRMEIDFHGDGPHRETMDGLDDYGPHVFAFLNDLFPETDVFEIREGRKTDGLKGSVWEFKLEQYGDRLGKCTVGNGTNSPIRRIKVQETYGITHVLNEVSGIISYRRSDKPDEVIRSTKERAIQNFASEVITKVRDRSGFKSSATWMELDDEVSTLQYSENAFESILNVRKACG